MPATDLPFGPEEYAARLAKTRAAMSARGIDTLIVTDPSNIAWLTGYDGWSFYVHQAAVIGMEGAPLWWGRNQDTQGALRTVYMPPEQVVGYPDTYVQSTERHPMDHLSDLLQERGHGAAQIGVEMDNYYFSAAAFAALSRNLEFATLIDATALVNWQRAV